MQIAHATSPVEALDYSRSDDGIWDRAEITFGLGLPLHAKAYSRFRAHARTRKYKPPHVREAFVKRFARERDSGWRFPVTINGLRALQRVCRSYSDALARARKALKKANSDPKVAKTLYGQSMRVATCLRDHSPSWAFLRNLLTKVRRKIM